MTDYLNMLTALLACVAALFGLGQFFRFRTRRDRLSQVGAAFNNMVSGFGSDHHIERLLSASLLPHFFDEKSEYGMKGTPYADDAIKLGAAVLKTESTGVVQKALADGLADAKSLAGVDFQRANLRNCYWGRRKDGNSINAANADFFRADLSASSLRGAYLSGSVFKEAQLVGTVMKDADLSNCNFDQANLRNALFDNARLLGATFVGARNIPDNIGKHLDKNGRFTNETSLPLSSEANTKTIMPKKVFLSCPSHCDEHGMMIKAQIMQGVSDAGLELLMFPPEEYGTGAPLDEVKQRICICDAVIILGIPQIEAAQVKWHKDTSEEKLINKVLMATPWNHIEAGIAVALDKPVLIIRDKVSEGVFEIGDQPHAITIIDTQENNFLLNLNSVIIEWAADLIQGFPIQQSLTVVH
jgi:hypothetical protein